MYFIIFIIEKKNNIPLQGTANPIFSYYYIYRFIYYLIIVILTMEIFNFISPNNSFIYGNLVTIRDKGKSLANTSFSMVDCLKLSLERNIMGPSSQLVIMMRKLTSASSRNSMHFYSKAMLWVWLLMVVISSTCSPRLFTISLNSFWI